MKHLRFILAGALILLIVCFASFVPLKSAAQSISSTIWQVIILSSIPSGASVDSTIHQVTIAGGALPITTVQGVAAGNGVFDNGTNLVSVPYSGDFSCSNSIFGFCTLGQIQGIPLTGSLTPATAGQIYCTNSSNQYVPCQLVNDQGTPINFTISGAVSNSTNRWNVCPRTMRYGPGAAGSSPFVASYGIAGGNPSAITTYAFNDAGTTIIDGYLQTAGVMNFGTPGCSANFDGTQGGGAFNRGAGPSTTVTLPASATAGDSALLVCSTLGIDGTGGFNNTGWTLPTGFSGNANRCFSGTGISVCVFEKNPISGGDLGATETCTYSATHTSGAAIYTFKGTPASGEVIDAVAATRNVTSTTPAFPGITPTKAGDFFINVWASGVSAGVLSAPPAPFTLGQTSNGQGVFSMWLGSSLSATVAPSATSTSGTSYGISMGLLSGSTACTLCTAGDKMEMLGPATAQSETDVAVDLNGVL